MSEWKDVFDDYRCIKGKFEEYDDSRCTCTGCQFKIRKGKKAISFSYSSNYGSVGHIRLCEDCIKELAERCEEDE